MSTDQGGGGPIGGNTGKGHVISVGVQPDGKRFIDLDANGLFHCNSRTKFASVRRIFIPTTPIPENRKDILVEWESGNPQNRMTVSGWDQNNPNCA